MYTRYSLKNSLSLLSPIVRNQSSRCFHTCRHQRNQDESIESKLKKIKSKNASSMLEEIVKGSTETLNSVPKWTKTVTKENSKSVEKETTREPPKESATIETSVTSSSETIIPDENKISSDNHQSVENIEDSTDKFKISKISTKDPAQLRSEFDFLLSVHEDPSILKDDEVNKKYRTLEDEINELYKRQEKKGDVERFIDSKTGHRVEKVKVPEYMHRYLGKSLDEKLDAAQDDLHEFFNNPRFTQTNPSLEDKEQWERDEYLDFLYFSRVATAPSLEVDEEEAKTIQNEIKKYEDEKLVEDFLREKSKDNADEEFAVLKFDHLQEIFYDRVFVEETEDGEYAVRCGMNRMLASQYGNIVLLPYKDMAVAIASEWEMQDVEIRGNLLPLTDLVTRAQDLHQEKEAKKGIKKKIHELFELDELIHREGVDSYLKSRMKAIWDPIVEWFNERYQTKLIIYEDSFQMGNEDEVLRAVKEKDILDNWSAIELVTLMQLTSVTDSVTISLAVMHGAITFDHAFHASNLPKIEQSDTHGIVEGEIDVTFQDRKYKLAAYYYWCQILREWKQEKLTRALNSQKQQESL